VAFDAGAAAVRSHPLLSRLATETRVHWDDKWPYADGWCVVEATGQVRANGRRRGDPAEWTHVLAHALLHLGLGHLQPHRHPRAWGAAADAEVERMLASLGLGRPPSCMGGDPFAGGGQDAAAMAQRAIRDGIPPDWLHLGTNGLRPDLELPDAPIARGKPYQRDWTALLADGVRDAVAASIRVAGGRQRALTDETPRIGPEQAAWSWFLASYPLLGSVCAAFRLETDHAACQRLGISIAAVDCSAGVVFANPAAHLSAAEWRFVMAHEVLHAALRHDARQAGRDALLWNYACDFAINLWLLDMGIGRIPERGLLLDEGLRGLPAETIYDRIVTERRRYRRLATLRGVEMGDVLHPGESGMEAPWGATSLDDVVRGALRRGLDLHASQNRGSLPGGLVEDIEAVLHPPPPWDVQLVRWADAAIPDAEPRRSYARASRRQGSTPDIPRPGLAPLPEVDADRTFAVLLDTSGSMDRRLLSRALGAVAQLAFGKQVRALRLVYCDAAPVDAGWVSPEELMGVMKVSGRGGTVLQDGIDLVGRFGLPEDTPLLVVTDGLCEPLRVRRPHAYLVPAGMGLPFRPDGPVFRLL
jgi:predicted metal-dependent peptidase